MNKFIKGLLYTVCYLIICFITMVILALSGAAVAFVPLIFVVPAVVLFLFSNRDSKPKKGSTAPSANAQSPTVPVQKIEAKGKEERLPSAKKCRQIADSLIADANQNIDFAYEESSITLFFMLGDNIKRQLVKAIKYEEKAGYSYIERPSYQLERFEDEFQWKLRDAIEREESKLIEEVLGSQRNNRRACCQRFLDEIESHKDLLSEETLEFAMNAYYHVCSVAGLNIMQSSIDKKEKSPMELVDTMEGHSFEYYCAGILSKNGFTNVEVTKGSGDQGIDILAEKDDIKYAIQCKCYSSDLGNKPVQEAFAGKSIYNCQIAAVLTNRFFTQGGIDAAKATGVLLWDRNKLQSLIDSAR